LPFAFAFWLSSFVEGGGPAFAFGRDEGNLLLFLKPKASSPQPQPYPPPQLPS
jgi:hypothetical protein